MHMLIAILMYFGLYTSPTGTAIIVDGPIFTPTQQMIQYYTANPDQLNRLVRIVDRRED